MKNVFRRVSTCLLCVTCLSAGIILPTTHMNIVFAQETQQQKDLLSSDYHKRLQKK